jgi:hypothetical protein
MLPLASRRGFASIYEFNYDFFAEPVLITWASPSTFIFQTFLLSRSLGISKISNDSVTFPSDFKPES